MLQGSAVVPTSVSRGYWHTKLDWRTRWQAWVAVRQAALNLQTAANDLDQHRRELAAVVGADLPPGNPAGPA